MGHLLNMMDVGNSKPETMLVKAIRSTHDAQRCATEYMSLGDPPERTNADSDQTRLLELNGHNKTLGEYFSDIPVARLDSAAWPKLQSLLNEIAEVIKTDGTIHFESTMKRQQDFKTSPMDKHAAAKHTVQDICNGALNGTDWHVLLDGIKTLNDVLAVAKKTLMSHNPSVFKKTALAYWDLTKQLDTVKERYQLAGNAEFEALHKEQALKMLVTHREGQILGVFSRTKTNPRKCCSDLSVPRKKRHKWRSLPHTTRCTKSSEA